MIGLKRDLVLSKKRGPEGDSVSVSGPKVSESSFDNKEFDPIHLAANDMMTAIHDRDSFKLKRAMKNFLDLHVNMPKDEE